MKTRHILLSFLSVSLLLLGIATPALADTNVSASASVRTEIDADRSAKKAEVQTDTDNLKSAVQAIRDVTQAAVTANPASSTNIRAGARAEIKDDRGNFRVDVAKVRVTTTTKVLTATVNRLRTIIDRIESRIDKVQAAGGSTVEAQASVDLARTSLIDAQAQATAISSVDLSGDTSTTTAEENYATVKSYAAKGRIDLESARQDLLKAVASLAVSSNH